MDDQDSRWPRELAIALGALLAVALVIGGVVGVVALGAVNVVGLGSGGSGASSQPTLYIPSSTPKPTPAAEPSASVTTPSATTPSTAEPSQEPNDEKKRRKQRPRITLSADPASAPANSRIYLTGTYRRGGGATLQVQRYDGGWGDFPVTVTVQAGTFETWIESGREGVNRFRVVDPTTGLASKPVSVTLT